MKHRSAVSVNMSKHIPSVDGSKKRVVRLAFLNSPHKNIQFTTEFEQDQEIPFLDVLIKRQPSNSFSTSICRKKTFTGVYTQWDSVTPRKYTAHLLIVVCEFVHDAVYYSLLQMILRSICHAMGIPVILFLVT